MSVDILYLSAENFLDIAIISLKMHIRSYPLGTCFAFTSSEIRYSFSLSLSLYIYIYIICSHF